MKNFAKESASSIWMHTFGGKGELADLLTKTAKVEESSLSSDTCEKLIDIFEDLDKKDAHPYIWRDAQGSDTRIWYFEKEIGDLIERFDIGRRVKAVEKYTARSVHSWCLMANRVVPALDNKGSGGGMHRDSPFSNQVKYIWYLSSVGGSNGPFQYLPGSNCNLIRDRHMYPLGESRYHELEGDFCEVIAPAGSLLVCDTKCIHGGKPIEDGVRYAVTLYTFVGGQSIRGMLAKIGLGNGVASQLE